MAGQDRFEHVLVNLYKAALADVEWVTAAALVNDMIQTRGHSLTYGDPCLRDEPDIYLARFFLGAERRKDLEQLYFRDYLRRDEAVPRLYRLGDGELVHKPDLYTAQEKKTSAAYNEYRLRNGMQNGLFMRLDVLDGCAMIWAFGDSAERNGWGHDQIRAIKRLAPHIRQFARVRHVMAEAEALGASLAELLENRRSGFIQLDHRGRILEANDRARGILLKRDGLYDEEGVLVAGNPGENGRLGRLLARALPPYGVQGAGGSMKITRRNGQAPVVLEIHPVRKMGTDYRGWRVGALALIVDPAARPRVDPDLAAAALGLTAAEGRVAVELATGQTVAGIADTLGCAESTVRTHLKQVYRKQGIRKQTELVRRVLSLETLREHPPAGNPRGNPD